MLPAFRVLRVFGRMASLIIITKMISINLFSVLIFWVGLRTQGMRILRVFRVLRVFGRIASLRSLINALAASFGPVLSAMFMCMVSESILVPYMRVPYTESILVPYTESILVPYTLYPKA